VAVLVGVESIAAAVTAAGVALEGVSSGSTEGRLQARTAASRSTHNSKQIAGLDITASLSPRWAIDEGIFVILRPALDRGVMVKPTV
jgi:hypothetical protein